MVRPLLKTLRRSLLTDAVKWLVVVLIVLALIELRRDGSLANLAAVLALGVTATLIVLAPARGELNDLVEQRDRQVRRLAASERRWRLLITQSPHAIAILDRELRYVAASRRWISDYRLDGSSLIGRSHYEVFPEIPERWKEIHRRCLAGEVARCDEEPFPRADGRVDWLRWEVQPWIDEDGHLAGLLMSTERLNDQRTAQEQLRRLASLAPVGIFMTDTGGALSYANRRLEELTGSTREQLLRDGLIPRVHADERDEMQSWWQAAMQSGTEFRAEFRLERGLHGSLWVDVRAVPNLDADGRLIGHIGTADDVTLRRQAEEALREARDAALRAAQSKAEFLANMSHEIRTPMNGVLGMAQLLEDTPLNEDQLDLVQTLRRSGEALLSIINEILDLSKVEAGKLTLEAVPFDLRQLLDDVRRPFESVAREKGIELAVDCDHSVPRALIGDPNRIRQIVVNLIGNAIKFTERGSVVALARLIEGGGGAALIEFAVNDSGIGIAPAQLRRIFEPFTQADASTTRRFGGTGLGLTICHRLAERMDGSLSVTSEVGTGSTFTLRVPLAVADAENLPTGPVQPLVSGQLAGQRVLLVEDNLVNQRLAERMLSRLGMVVTTAADGLQALDSLQAQAFDVVLMDCQMPECDGYEATRRLRAREAESGVHQWVIAMTAHAMDGDRERCIEAGMDDYLAKPIRRADLIAALNRRQVLQTIG